MMNCLCQQSRIVVGGGACITWLSNKELERTRSTQTAVGPRRSIRCYAELGGSE